MRNRVLITLLRWVALVAALAPAQLWAQSGDAGSWTGWRGPNLDLTVVDAGGPIEGGSYRLGIVWKRELGSGYSAVSIAGGIAVTGFSEPDGNYIGAFGASDGQELWRYRMAPMFPGRFGSSNGPISTPLIADGRVFALDNSGKLCALELATGDELWRADLVELFGAERPFYGYASSPLRYGNSVIVQTGGPDRALARFDAQTGEVVWAAGEALTQYQSASLVDVNGRLHVVLVGIQKLVGIDPDTGAVLWRATYSSEGLEPIGTATTNVVPVSDDTFLLKGRDGSTLFRLNPDAPEQALAEIWQSRDLKNTYVVSVHRDGVIYGYNNRILNAVDAETGRRLWRSREPGDGLPIIVNDHLVIVTKDGRLSLGHASHEGYVEAASLELFDDLVWTPAAYVDGSLYLRSFGEIARVDIVPSDTATRVADRAEGILSDSDFEQWADSVRAAPAGQRPGLIDDWLRQQSSFPVIEGDSRAHFVYRGPAVEVALVSDLFGGRTDRKMYRIPDTDFFYFSAELESDARIKYGFIRDFEHFEPDPRNPRRPRIAGDSSELTMPAWSAPAHLEPAPPDRRGRIERETMESSIRGREIELSIYLPNGFTADRRYPIVYMLDTPAPMAEEFIQPSLDNLIGATVEPLIVVFVPYFGQFMPYFEYVGEDLESYVDVLVSEIVPFIEGSYPTLDDPQSRALVARRDSTYSSVYAAFRHPGLIGKLGLQSMRWEPGFRARNRQMLLDAPDQPLTIYLDWGKYDGKSEREGFDIRASSMAFAEDLQEAGYAFVGGEVHDGSGPDSWLQRTDALLEALFPLER